MIEFKFPNIKYTEISDYELNISIAPLERGYGYTIGNLIKKYMLRARQGAAVIGYKCDQNNADFNRDDLECWLKSITVANELEEEQVIYEDYIFLKGIPVTAMDLETKQVHIYKSDEVFIPNKNIKLSVAITKGRGYGTDFPLKEDFTPIGANFTNIETITYQITPTRVGNKLDQDNLQIKLCTRNSKAKAVVEETVLHIIRSLEPIISIGHLDTLVKMKKSQKKKEAFYDDSLLIEDVIPLSNRSKNALYRNEILTINQLVTLGKKGLCNMRGIGTTTLNEIIKNLSTIGITLK